MPVSIKDPETERLARRLSAVTGETITAAVRQALRERLQRVEGRSTSPRLTDELRAIRERCAALPVLDPRGADEIVAYDEFGVPR
jgi:antitoxin VapB